MSATLTAINFSLSKNLKKIVSSVFSRIKVLNCFSVAGNMSPSKWRWFMYDSYNAYDSSKLRLLDTSTRISWLILSILLKELFDLNFLTGIRQAMHALQELQSGL